MGGSNHIVGGCQRQRNSVRKLFAAFVAMVASAGQGAVAQTIDKVNIRREGTEVIAEFTVTQASAGSVAGSGCPQIVGALVIEQGQTVDLISFTQDDAPLTTGACTTGEFSQTEGLAFALEEEGLFDFDTQALFCRTFEPLTCAGQSLFVLRYRVLEDGVPIIPTRITAAGTTADDFPALANVHFFDLPIPDPQIPAVSQWGLVVLTLLLLAGARIQSRRRVKPAVAALSVRP